jgi:hypothetical protein
MKKILFGISVMVLIATACNNDSKTAKEGDSTKLNTDTSKIAVVPDTSKVATITHTFNSVDPKLATSLNAIFDHYLHIKNALIANNGEDAAKGAKEMGEAMSKVDKSLFTAEQKKVYDPIEEDLKEHAEHIGSNGGKIKHQREHFSMMSEDVYTLVKAFGAGRTVYHDHCPMVNDNKGGMWLSEYKEVKNPYFGGEMNGCVTVEEQIK